MPSVIFVLLPRNYYELESFIKNELNPLFPVNHLVYALSGESLNIQSLASTFKSVEERPHPHLWKQPPKIRIATEPLEKTAFDSSLVHYEFFEAHSVQAVETFWRECSLASKLAGDETVSFVLARPLDESNAFNDEKKRHRFEAFIVNQFVRNSSSFDPTEKAEIDFGLQFWEFFAYKLGILRKYGA